MYFQRWTKVFDYREVMEKWNSAHTHWLTEVEDHAGENYESKPDTEVRDKVDDGDDDVTDGGQDAEQDVARDANNDRSMFVVPSKIRLGSWSHVRPKRLHRSAAYLSRLLMEEVPRSTLLSTSPVRLSRCQRRDRPCRWENKHTWRVTERQRQTGCSLDFTNRKVTESRLCVSTSLITGASKVYLNASIMVSYTQCFLTLSAVLHVIYKL